MPTPRIYASVASRYQGIFSKKSSYAIYIGSIVTLVVVDNLFGEETHFVAGKAIFVMLVATIFLSAVHLVFKPRPATEEPQINSAVQVLKALVCNALLCLAAYALLSGFIRGHLGYNAPEAKPRSIATQVVARANEPSA